MTGLRRLVLAALVLVATGCAAPSPPPPGAQRPVQPVQPLVLEPVVPGWSPVRAVTEAVTYDVPPDWSVGAETAATGSALVAPVGAEAGDAGEGGAEAGDAGVDGDGDPVADLTGTARYARGSCGGQPSVLAWSGVQQQDGTDLAEVAAAGARRFAGLAYPGARQRPPRLVLSKAEPVLVQGDRPAVLVRADARAVSPTGTCAPSRGTVYVLAAAGLGDGSSGTVVLVVVADTHRTGAVSDTQVRTVLGTLRPV